MPFTALNVKSPCQECPLRTISRCRPEKSKAFIQKVFQEVLEPQMVIRTHSMHFPREKNTKLTLIVCRKVRQKGNSASDSIYVLGVCRSTNGLAITLLTNWSVDSTTWNSMQKTPDLSEWYLTQIDHNVHHVPCHVHPGRVPVDPSCP